MSINRTTAKVSAIVLVAGASLASQAQPAMAADTTGEITASALYARQAPSQHARATFLYPQGERVPLGCKVTGPSVNGNNIWYAIAGSNDRWLSARYVKNIGAAPEYCDPLDGYVKGRTTARLNARTGPTVNDAARTVHNAGTMLDLQCKVTSHAVGGNTTWYHTSTGQWVSARYVANVGQAPRQCGEGWFPTGD